MVVFAPRGSSVFCRDVLPSNLQSRNQRLAKTDRIAGDNAPDRHTSLLQVVVISDTFASAMSPLQLGKEAKRRKKNLRRTVIKVENHG
jgi:hypothetical protein